MDERQWEKTAALGSGLLFVVLVLVSGLLPGSPPSLSDSAAKIGKYFADHRDEIKIATYLGGLAFVPILVWLGFLWRSLRRAEGGEPRLTVVAAAGLIVGGSCIAVSGAVTSVTAARLGAIGPFGARFFFTLAAFIAGAGSFGFAVLVGATAVVVLRSRVFPPWFGWFSIVLAIGWLVAGVGVASTSNTYGIIGFIVLLFWLAWVLMLSVFMYLAVEPIPSRAAR